MTEFENKWQEKKKEWMEKRKKYSDGKGHIWTGAFLIIVGIAFLLDSAVPGIPHWVISWEMLLIALGLFIGLRHRFRSGVWFVLIIIGGVFLLNDIYEDISLNQYLLPLGLILVGSFFILRPKKKRGCWGEEDTVKSGDRSMMPAQTSSESFGSAKVEATPDDYVDSTSVFGGIRKNIVSKNFKGGDVVNIFGGAELNLGQSDIHGKVELEVTQLFGGTKLFVPSNWEVKPEMVAIFGGIEDKRDMSTMTNPDKVLVLKGTSIFAGIEIRNL